MARTLIQSAIQEVRDQMSLDFADDTHLNVVTENLGLSRPVFGFTDDLWRAVVKALAIEYKQVKTKFSDVMAILFGPATTLVGTLAQEALIGEDTIVMNDTSTFPQIGTMVLDSGQPTEETVSYFYIDRYTNTVWLTEALTQNHLVREWDAEQPVIIPLDGTNSTVVVPYSNYFPSTDLPVTAVLRRGYTSEVVSITAHNTATHTLTLSGPTTTEHSGVVPSVIYSDLNGAYAANSTYLSVSSTSQFPASGMVLLGPSAGTFTVSSATTTVIDVGAPTFTGGALAGYKLLLATGEEAWIESNTTTEITLATPVTLPSGGDLFTIRPAVEFTSNDVESNTLQLRRMLPTELSFSSGTKVELLEVNTTIALAPVLTNGTGWDIIQVDPRHVELLIPDNIQDERNLRSASYIHNRLLEAASTQTADAALIGDVELLLDTTLDLPVAGILLLDAGGPNEERVAYGLKRVSDIIASVAQVTTVGTASLTEITLTTGGLPVSSFGDRYVYINGRGYAVLDNDATTITLDNVMPNHALDEIVAGTTPVYFYSADTVVLPDGLTANHSIAESAELWEPNYVGTDLLVGDLYEEEDVFPGPYVYAGAVSVPAGEAGPAPTLSDTLAAPTRLVSWRTVGMTALEVDDASSFPLTGFPHSVLVGRGTGNRETVSVTDINLKQRTGTTLTGGPYAPGTSVVFSVTSVTGVGSASDFPNCREYRVLVGRGTANVECCTVIATSSGGNTITVKSTTNTHNAAETIELMHDVLTVASLDDDHRGYLTHGQRGSRWPRVEDSNFAQAESVEMLYSSITLSSTASLPDSGTLLLNFGNQRLSAKTTVFSAVSVTDTLINVADSSAFPTSYPYKVRLGAGRANEEMVIVTNNDGAGGLTISNGARFTHNVGDSVQFVAGQSESLEYTSIVGSTIRFSTPVVVEYDHHSGESVFLSLTDSEPRRLGYDFPLRMPPDIYFRIGFLFDLIRAAGVKVSVINKR